MNDGAGPMSRIVRISGAFPTRPNGGRWPLSSVALRKIGRGDGSDLPVLDRPLSHLFTDSFPVGDLSLATEPGTHNGPGR